MNWWIVSAYLFPVCEKSSGKQVKDKYKMETKMLGWSGKTNRLAWRKREFYITNVKMGHAIPWLDGYTRYGIWSSTINQILARPPVLTI